MGCKMTDNTNEPDKTDIPNKPTDPAPFSPAFTLNDGDRFHCILVSHGVTYKEAPAVETVLTFFVIRRSSGKYSMVNILKTYNTFDGSKCISKKANAKHDIPEKRIDFELKGIKGLFTYSIEEKSGVKLEWESLDLKDIVTMAEQVKKIQAWGLITAFVDTGEISLN
jgi:hypothetical protein